MPVESVLLTRVSCLPIECIPILFQTIDNAIDKISSYRLIFYLDKKDEIYHYIAQKSILKLVKLQSLIGCDIL
jgi:hypothetical protein